MTLTRRERAIVELLRSQPLLDAGAIAEAIGSTRSAVSVHLSNLMKKGAILGRGYVVRTEPGVVVVGGANMDIKARTLARPLPATSNPGTVVSTPGGVGRNIAENLARLGRRTHLVAAVGADALGEQLVAYTSAAGVHTQHVVVSPHPTGTYLAVLDDRGELVVGISDMSATDTLTVDRLGRSRELTGTADLLVLDGNLAPAVIGWLLDIAAASKTPTVVEPVSVAKARRLAPMLGPARPIFAITPNVDELAALVGSEAAHTRRAIASAARRLHDQGITHVWVRRGPQGSLLSTQSEGHHSLVPVAAPRTRVVDVTGAGDAMTAAFAHAILRGDAPVAAAEYGHRAAALTVASQETVRSDLTDTLIASLEPSLDGGLDHGRAPQGVRP